MLRFKSVLQQSKKVTFFPFVCQLSAIEAPSKILLVDMASNQFCVCLCSGHDMHFSVCECHSTRFGSIWPYFSPPHRAIPIEHVDGTYHAIATSFSTSFLDMKGSRTVLYYGAKGEKIQIRSKCIRGKSKKTPTHVHTHTCRQKSIVYMYKAHPVICFLSLKYSFFLEQFNALQGWCKRNNYGYFTADYYGVGQRFVCMFVRSLEKETRPICEQSAGGLYAFDACFYWWHVWKYIQSIFSLYMSRLSAF